MKKLNTTISALAMIFAAGGVNAADWQINNEQSKLSFISVKKGDIAEVHHFKKLTGQLSDAGEFSLTIALDSVDTAAEIRDERMKEFLFDTANYASATLTAQIDPALVNDLAVGSSTTATVEAELSLHGQTQTLTFDTVISKLSDTELLVVSAKPVLLNADDYQLAEGIEKLKELAQLPTISHAVPVSFYLSLNAQ